MASLRFVVRRLYLQDKKDYQNPWVNYKFFARRGDAHIINLPRSPHGSEFEAFWSLAAAYLAGALASHQISAGLIDNAGQGD
jgi:hypothetical protein